MLLPLPPLPPSPRSPDPILRASPPLSPPGYTCHTTHDLDYRQPSLLNQFCAALLTQLDRVGKLPNVLILTTSNITGAIDIAFLDRADLKLYVGPPSLTGRYNVLAGCIEELARVGLVNMDGQNLYPYKALAREHLLTPCSPGHHPHERYGTSIKVSLG